MKRSVKIVISVLVVLNIVLLIQNYFLKKEETHTSDEYQELRSEFYEFGGGGKLLNPLPHFYTDIKLTPENQKLNSNSVFLLVVFDDHGCPRCVKHHIEHLNDFPENLKDYLTVVYDGTQKDYLRNFKPAFAYLTKDTQENIFNKTMDYVKPLAFLMVDNSVYMLHRTETNSDLKTDLFYERVIEVLEKVYLQNAGKEK